jgi:hypothetical protein
VFVDWWVNSFRQRRRCLIGLCCALKVILLRTKEGLKGVVFDGDRRECVVLMGMGMDEATGSVLVDRGSSDQW